MFQIEQNLDLLAYLGLVRVYGWDECTGIVRTGCSDLVHDAVELEACLRP